ncbi:MAG TPA: DUF6691 family protein [Polyangiales bacterium]
MLSRLLALTAGLAFALGLGIAGMTRPANVIAFLDVTGSWDPALAFVMMGAVGVHALALLLGRRRTRPLLEPRFETPSKAGIDARLIAGAAIFGVGWGASGFCPGPALVALMSFSPSVLAFVPAMVVGTATVQRVSSRVRAQI